MTILLGCEEMKIEEVNLQPPNVITKQVNAVGNYPNSILPVVVYKAVVNESDSMLLADYFQSTFRGNGWKNSWRNGLYTFHHYHSKTHEALAIYRGWVEVQLGGPTGDVVKLQQGDVAIIPAGVAHKNIKQSSDFSILGAYPEPLYPDMMYGKAEELASAKYNISQVPLPKKDPLFSKEETLIKLWK